MKRILALEGGGLRGIIEVAYLERLEALVKERRGPDTRLSDVFDLVGGASTGAILATSVALGLTVEEMKSFYFERATRIFKPSLFRVFGLLPAYSGKALEAEFRDVAGDAKIGGPEVKTRLALVLKRVDTGAPWIVSNLPDAPYFADPPDRSYIGNRNFELAKLLRASAAAPGYFSPARIQIHEGVPDGVFVDGGISPYNDPSLALLMLAQMKVYGLNWPVGTDQMSLISMGCGKSRRVISEQVAKRSPQLAIAGLALLGMIQDNEAHSTTMMQWLGKSLLPHPINSELGDMAEESFAPAPLFNYLRLNYSLDRAGLADLGFDVEDARIEKLRAIDDPGVVQELYDITKVAAERQLKPEFLDQMGF